MITKLVMKLLAVRRRVRVVPERRLPPGDVYRALAVANDDPQWRAMHQLLDAAVGDLVEAVSAARLADGERAHAAGGIDALRDFQGRLLEARSLGLRADPGKEAGD
jgi:hypothetical protein